ncbi:MAG: transketolase-like TK C-terminal-containing protein [Acidimicrobiia bacterium]
MATPDQEELRPDVILHRVDGSDLVIVATGSEVHLGLTARDTLAAAGISARVVSMPSWELFDAQPFHYRDDVLPPGVPRLGVEAGRGLSWCRFTDDVGSVESFGPSASAADLFETNGLTPDHIARRAEALVARARRVAVPARGAG